MADGRHWKEEFLNEEGKMKNGSPAKEAVYFTEIAGQIRDVVQHFEEDNNGIKRRANHAKILAGFTNAVFRVLPATESTNAVLVGFLSPGKEYKATLRMSNASAEWKKSDRKPDLRGIAVRIHTEDGDQDFLMTNAEPHHAKDAREAMFAIMAGVEKDVIEDLIPDVFPGEDALAGALGALPYLVKHLGLTGFHIASTLKKQMNIKVESLATETFWSRAPIAIGPDPSPETAVAVKYRLRPAIEKIKDQRLIEAPKKLDVELMNRLMTSEVKYFFEVQFFD
ncbi:MAG TPA: catalase, partial [Saprospiraceae bacterium]|nr:catalase [Saprospiraceae bacterium]